MTFEQQTATLEATGAIHAITTAMQDACAEIAKHDPVEKTPEAMLAFCEGLLSLLNVAHGEICRANADMAEALARANPPPTSLN